MTPPGTDPAHDTTAAALFDDDYRRILAPFHSDEDARRETAALRDLVGIAQDDRVLDLGCGWGRHLRLLAGAGHDVTGVDLSWRLLGHVSRGPGPVRRPALATADMRALPLAHDSFDVVLNLATSLGLFLEDDDAMRALREVRRVLRPAGRFLLEGMHRDDVVAGYAERDAWTLDDGTVIRARRRFDPLRGVSHEVLRWRDADGGTRTKCHSLRLRSATELIAMLRAAGLAVLDARGDWDLRRFTRDSPRLILLASPS